LSLPVYSVPALSEDVEALARKMAGADANAEIKEGARRVAEAQIDLRRIGNVRGQLLSCALEKLAGPQELAAIIPEDTKQLLAIDRYERRALSRRKFAIRAFDAARRRTGSGGE
jgi:hypothetical protein